MAVANQQAANNFRPLHIGLSPMISLSALLGFLDSHATGARWQRQPASFCAVFDRLDLFRQPFPESTGNFLVEPFFFISQDKVAASWSKIPIGVGDSYPSLIFAPFVV